MRQFHTRNKLRLQLLPKDWYISIDESDPLRFYYSPIIGKMYHQRVEMCLAECRGGDKVLDVGFGSGVNFLNLNEMYREIHGLDLEVEVNLVAERFKEISLHLQLRNGNVLDMPYPNDTFDTVLLVSILEHIKPDEQVQAFNEIKRVLKPGGQVVYGVPVEHPIVVFAFHLLKVDIREHHFSTEKDVFNAARKVMEQVRIIDMKPTLPIIRSIYQVGHFVKR